MEKSSSGIARLTHRSKHDIFLAKTMDSQAVDPLASPMPHNENPMDKQFAPKTPVQLDAPKHDLISQEDLAAADGINEQ